MPRRGKELSFLVVIKDSAGVQRGSLDPEKFRAGTHCPKAAFLPECVERWNEFQRQQGAEDRASVELELVSPAKRRRRR